jgi:hypothetical protein
MADTIRERIIAAITAKLAEIRTANGYVTELGQHVERAAANIAAADLPAITLFPRVETSAKEYGKQICSMPVEIKALKILGTSNASTLGEQMLGDLITCILGAEFTRTFTSGGTYTVKAGDTIVGATSNATGVVVSVALTGGSWAAGTAAGTIRFRSQTGTFQAEALKVLTNADVATIAGAATAISAKDISGGLLVDDIAYIGGGVEDYPATKDEAVIVTATFTVTYMTTIGDPTTQT